MHERLPSNSRWKENKKDNTWHSRIKFISSFLQKSQSQNFHQSPLRERIPFTAFHLVEAITFTESHSFYAFPSVSINLN